MKKNKAKKEVEKLALERDFSEGYGGIPQDVELTKNIGCASGGNKKSKPTVSQNHKNTNE